MTTTQIDGLNFSSIGEMKAAVTEARDAARAEAVRDCVRGTYLQSRGTFLCTAAANGEQCSPAPEAEGHGWRGSMKSVVALVEPCRLNASQSLGTIAGNSQQVFPIT